MDYHRFFDELTFWILLAVAIALFTISFKAFGKIALSKYGPSGLQEAFAS